MKNNLKKIIISFTAAILVIGQMTACSKPETTSATTAGSSQTSQETESSADPASGNPSEDIQVTAELGEGTEKTITYRSEDADSGWDAASAVTIELADSGITAGSGAVVSGQTVTISNAGTYIINGTLTDGQIRIDTRQGELVRLVLNGVQISNQTTAPIYSEGKGKVVLTLADKTVNTVSDGGEYTFADATEDEPNAAIFTKGDLSINGTGSLNVTGNYECAIRSKAVLTVASGNLDLMAVSDGLKGKDGVVIRDGKINIVAGKDGIKSNQDTDPELGYIWIDGGQITISAEDDGIQAESQLIVLNGEITITDSQEALAGKTVDINGGMIKAVALDDGINSAATVTTEQEKMQNQEGVYTRIAGGEIWLNAKADGIDSNGDLYIDGGVLYLSGPVDGGNGILDYNGEAYLTGGTIFAAGTASMMQTFAETSTQQYLVVYYDQTQPAGTNIILKDSDGNELGSFAPEKEYGAVIISTAELETGKEYQILTGENAVTVTIESIETVSGTAAGGMGRPGGMGGGMRGGERPAGAPENGEFPNRDEIPADGERPTGGARPHDGELPADSERPTGRARSGAQPTQTETAVAETTAASKGE